MNDSGCYDEGFRRLFQEELLAVTFDKEKLKGILILDKIDHDFSFVILKDGSFFDCQVSFPTPKKAYKKMIAVMQEIKDD